MKTVYLATPKGPVAYNLDGAWLSLATNGTAPVKRRKRRTKAEFEAAKAAEGEKPPKAPKTKPKVGSKPVKKEGKQATI